MLAQQVKNIWMSAAGCFGTLLEMSVAASPSTQVKGKGFFAEWRARREVQAAASPFGEAQDPVRLAAVFEALSGQFDVSSWLPCAVLLISLYQSQSFTAAFALAHLGPKLVPALWRLCYAMAPLFVLPNVPAAMMEAAHVCWSLFGAAMTCTLAVVDDDEFLAGVPFTLQNNAHHRADLKHDTFFCYCGANAPRPFIRAFGRKIHAGTHTPSAPTCAA